MAGSPLATDRFLHYGSQRAANRLRRAEELEVIAADPALDAALLDVNVAGRAVFPVAQALADKGVPFLFSTGYGEGGLPDDWRGRPTIQKPFTEATVREALQKTLGISLA
jgi:hypothetical protein